MKTRSGTLGLVLLIALFAVVAYGPSLGLPFIGDDYVFLDKTRDATFWNLWSFRNTDFGWFRPWSREFYFWILQRIAGVRELPFRVAGLVLWIIALSTYAAVVRRVASRRVATIATLGVASLALWGTPLVWISGSQDLWMLCFTLASALLFMEGRIGWSLAAFGLALLSKETSAVLPILIGAYVLLVERRRFMDAVRRTVPYWALALVWFCVHPTLLARLLPSGGSAAELEHRPLAPGILAKTVLSTLNLDMVPHPQEVDRGVVLRVALCALILAVGVARVAGDRDAPKLDEDNRTSPGTVLRFGAAWAAIGWIPLFLPSIAWHAYYGCLGALGAWLAIACWLRDRQRIAVAVIVGLAILRGAQANTLTWDWGNESYVRRAGSILSAIRDELYRQHPTLPLHSRVYFVDIPNNIGLIAGQSPAVRVWYRDSTLQAGFYSYYRPRGALAPRGEDLFFRFDSAVGMVEVKAGAEDVPLGIRSDLDWERDHQDLAVLFLRNGDMSRAALEFEKLSALVHRADAAIFAGVCWEFAGDTTRASSLFSAGRSRLGLTEAQLREREARLRRTLPRP